MKKKKRLNYVLFESCKKDLLNLPERELLYRYTKHSLINADRKAPRRGVRRAHLQSNPAQMGFVPDSPSNGFSVPDRAGGTELPGTGMSISMDASDSSRSASSNDRASSIRIFLLLQSA